MILDAYLAGLFPQNGQPQTQTQPQGGEGFQAVMDRAGEAQPSAEKAPAPERAESPRRSDSREARKAQKPQRAEQKRPERAENAKAETADGTERTDSPGERTGSVETGAAGFEKAAAADKTTGKAAEQTADADGTGREQAEAELKQKLADALDLPLEEVEKLLAVMGIQLADLADPAVLNGFMQAAYQAESPMELLSVPDIGNVFAEVKSLAAQAAALPQPTAGAQAAAEAVPSEGQTEIPQGMTLVENGGEPIELEQEAKPAATAPNAGQTAVKTETEATAQPEAEQAETAEATELAPETSSAAASAKAQAETAEEEQLMAEPELENAEAQEPREATAPAAATAQAQTGGQGDMDGGDSQWNSRTQTGETPDIAPVSIRETVQFAQSAARAALTARAASPREIINQLLERVRVDVRAGGVSEMRVTLQPESLGDVTLRVVSENGVVTAHFVAETQRVKEVIESNLERLKESLAEQGVAVSNLEVEVETGQQERQMAEFLREQQRTNGRVRDIINRVSAEEQGGGEPSETAAAPDSSVEFTA